MEEIDLTMTEAEWLTGNAQLMLAHLRDAGLLTRRKALLLACACCRSLGKLLWPESALRAVELIEATADGAPDAEAMRQALIELEERLERTLVNVRCCSMLAVIHALEAALGEGDLCEKVSDCLRNGKRAVELQRR